MTQKTEALDALTAAQKLLDGADPLTPLRVRQVQATLEYAVACVERIEELKRKRKGGTR